jgi:hypothetical protein
MAAADGPEIPVAAKRRPPESTSTAPEDALLGCHHFSED